MKKQLNTIKKSNYTFNLEAEYKELIHKEKILAAKRRNIARKFLNDNFGYTLEMEIEW